MYKKVVSQVSDDNKSPMRPPKPGDKEKVVQTPNSGKRAEFVPKPRPVTGKVRNPISPKPDQAKVIGRPSPKRSSEVAGAKPSRLNQRNSEAGPSSGENDPKRANPYKPMFNDFKNPYVGANGAQSDRH